MATTFTKELKPGNSADITLTWDDMTETWNEVLGTWNEPRRIDFTTYTKETKPTSTFTKETKP